jgi:hypothetical protein
MCGWVRKEEQIEHEETLRLLQNFAGGGGWVWGGGGACETTPMCMARLHGFPQWTLVDSSYFASLREVAAALTACWA